MQKKLPHKSGWKLPRVQFKLFLLMKVGILLMTLACMHVSASAISQKISLSVENVPMEQVIKMIKKRSGYQFIYNNELLKRARPVTINVSGGTLEQVLEKCFSNQPLTYVLVDKTIVIKPKEAEPVQQQSVGEVQAVKVKGRVTDEKGAGLPGVNILIKGTVKGTLTDKNGQFELEIADENAILLFSYLGYLSQEVRVGTSTSLEISLKTDIKVFNEVVVTALGISKDAKALTYATQKIKGEELTRVKDMNYVNSLAGKVAGAIITRGTMGPGSATRILIRGNKSFTGSSSPLYVIDGVPSSIEFNPDDIESIQILTGASAAALYGSRAANGVVLITTKKGKKGVSKIDFSSSYTIENAIDLPQLQTSYGRTDPQYNDSWGEKITNGSDRHLKEFFKTGVNKINSISLSNGSDNAQYYLSYANSNATGILPENKHLQNNFTLKISTQFFDDKLSVDGSINYVSRKTYNQNSPGGISAIPGLYSFPIDDDWSKYSGANFEVWDPTRQVNVQNWPYIRNETFPSQNPYWVQNRNQTDNFHDRVVSSFVGKYKLLNWLDIQARTTYDFEFNHFEKRNYASTQATIEGPNGGYGIENSKSKGLYTDLLLLGNKKFGNFSISGILGLSDSRRTASGLTLLSTVETSLSFPNFFSVYALNGLYYKSEYLQKTLSQAAFGSFSFDYNERLFLDVTGRKEWSSTVAESFFYPSLGLSYILKQTNNDLFSYAKLRASYSEVGNSLPFGISNITPPYALDNSGNIVGRSTLPFFDGSDTITLRPERTRSFEFGLDLNFIKNKLNLNITYYNTKTYDQVLSIQAPAGSGAQNFWINGGIIRNTGIEGIISYKSSFGKLKWSPSLNFSRNRNRVLELSNLLNAEYFVLGYHATHGNYLRRPKDGVYGAFGDVFGKVYLKDENGNYLTNDKGIPLISDFEDKFIGNVNPKLLAGFNNTFNYGGFAFSFLVDCRFGGMMFNRTELWLDYKGFSKRTGEARDMGGVPVNGKLVDAKEFYLNQTGSGKLPVATEYFFDATNVRLRELSLGYSFGSLTKGISQLNVSFIARNLFFFYKNAPFDPEIGIGSSPAAEGTANFVLPSTRYFGLSVNVSLSSVKKN